MPKIRTALSEITTVSGPDIWYNPVMKCKSRVFLVTIALMMILTCPVFADERQGSDQATKTAAEDVASEKAAQKEVALGEETQGKAAPNAAAQDEPTQSSTAPEEFAQSEAGPGNTAPEAAASGNTAPEESAQ